VHCLADNGARSAARSVAAMPLRATGDVERSDLVQADRVVIGRATFDALPAGRWRIVAMPFEGPELHVVADIPESTPRIEVTAVQPVAATVQLRLAWPAGAERPELVTLEVPPGAQFARLGDAQRHRTVVDPRAVETLRVRDVDPGRQLVVRAEGGGWRGVVRAEAPAPGATGTATLAMQREATVVVRSDGPLDYDTLRLLMRHEAEPWGYPVDYGVATGRALRHEVGFPAGRVQYRLWLPTEGTSNTDERSFREGTLVLEPGGTATPEIPTTAR
jgi:hypothetical protein